MLYLRFVQIRREKEVTVEFKLTFLKINDIDTLSQQFEAEVYVQSKWEEPALELDKLLPCDLWDPQLIIVNIAGDFDQEIRSFVVRYEQGYKNPVVLHRWRFKGLFRKALELRHFPFDVQDLTIQLSTERSFEEIKMTHDKQQLSSVNTRTFQDSQEWSIYNHVQCDYRNTTVQYASSTIHPILVFSCRVRRRVGYFMWNIVFIVFLVLMLSLLSVAIEPASSDRLASTMTLFLTMVAFKLVVKQSLPTISYLTYLDIYVLGSLIYLVLYAMENSAMISMGRWLDSELVEAYDEFFCMFLGAILVLFHLIFIIHIQVTVSDRGLLSSGIEEAPLDDRQLHSPGE
ncbi:cys-loop ligand-gated ion channel-like [Babylonia areolata]|uniref:cys-loop ligand-gated ion channel-like n=1 Tax=Babylonia areolata TaxID=304850 RepID=UPI003FD23441